MVRSDGGQLYTIEGIAAGLIMIMTAYLVVSATSVYTAGDTHISDMQLEQLGTDALRVMDTPPNKDTLSNLSAFVKDDNGDGFNKMFLNITDNRTLSGPDHIQFMANVSYYDINNGTTENYLLNASRNLSGGEHAVRATKWVIVDKQMPGSVTKPRAVLVEVLMWRD